MEKIIFLDRDGTINEDYGYVVKPEQIKLIPGAAAAIAKLKEAGFRIVVVSNQSAVGRGIASIDDIEATNDELRRQLLEEHSAAKLDLLLYSTDHPSRASDRRKPATGMLREVKAMWHFDPCNCWLVGDKESDLAFGTNAGIPQTQCLLVRTGHGEEEYGKLSQPEAILAFSSLLEASSHILD